MAANPPSSGNRTDQTAQTTANSAFFRKIDDIKKLFTPSLTSYFQCVFEPPQGVIDWLRSRGMNYADFKDLISISCTDASLPGSSLMTNEIIDDYTGVTERHAYRRQYDDRADFTFYVSTENDYNKSSYDVIWFFENWISYIVNEQLSDAPANASAGIRPVGILNSNYFYRNNFPELYRNIIYINKFEKELRGKYLNYQFLDAYPISITSMPVSYESISILKCTVSFTYTRYAVRRLSHSSSDVVSSLDVRPINAGVPLPASPPAPPPVPEPRIPQLPPPPR